MARHQFGGDWTAEKLARVRKYLEAYMTIFTENEWARRYTTVYLDAFAGTGHWSETAPIAADAGLLGEAPDPEAESFKKGSARIALEIEPSFRRYVFIEQNAERVTDLEQLRAGFPAKAASVEIVQAEANAFLQDWCRKTDWARHRAVIFLDPYGMQVEWATIEAIAQTKAVDLWYLFPLGVAVNRLLTRSDPPSGGWADALTRIFGTTAWREVFYRRREELTLFGGELTEEKEADFARIGGFFVSRLKTVFSRVAENPLPLRNSTNTPLYLLCFAAGNAKGAPTAVKIAQHILKD
jgi:three-Cys-motif partner protein